MYIRSLGKPMYGYILLNRSVRVMNDISSGLIAFIRH